MTKLFTPEEALELQTMANRLNELALAKGYSDETAYEMLCLAKENLDGALVCDGYHCTCHPDDLV